MERNRNTVDDYLSIIEEQPPFKYVDHNFPIVDALYWKDAGESQCDNAGLVFGINWKRISDSDFHPSPSFWGTSSINPKDIVQGYIGNCWIMAAISAIAEVPERVENFFVSDDLSP